MNKQNSLSRVSSYVSCSALILVAMVMAGGNARSQQSPTPPQGKPAMQQMYLGRDPKTFKDGRLYSVWPSDTDPELKRYAKPNLVLTKNGLPRTAKLLVFLPGTGGEPNGSWPFLEAGADAGYRVIGLMYDNNPSVVPTCGPQADPACADRFREKRIFGDGVSSDIDDLPVESVVNRLVKLLQYLDKNFADEGWGRYLLDGQPNWSRIAVAGHSQGGGVAAYIAKKRSVYRVINLSGAWDRSEPAKQWAPWISSPSATPMDRWYAAYHAKESNAAPMREAYVVLKIPPDHIRVLTLEPNPANTVPKNADVYHISMAATSVTPLDANGKPAYAADWAFLLGQAK
jgi:pimeloyl-ACP methyl ester carboxylesterase